MVESSATHEDDGVSFGATIAPMEAPRRRNRISEAFASRPISMLRSAPYRVLNNAKRIMLDRIEIEFSEHGGHDNGRLPVTFENFIEYGIRRASISPSRRALLALGFITFEAGLGARAADKRRPNLFGMTYRPLEGASHPTNDWRRLSADLAECARIADEARDTLDDGEHRRRRGPPVILH